MLKIKFYRQRIYVTCFLLFIFAICLAYAIVIPYNDAPDEEMHFQIVNYIFRHGSLPHGGDPEIRSPIWGLSYGFTPYLPYIIGALFVKISSFFSMDINIYVIAARMVSVLCGVFISYYCIKISQNLFTKYYRWLFVIFCVLLPGTVFLFSYINCDSMSVLSSAMIIYAWIRGLKTKWDFRYCVLLAIGISVCILSYFNAYGYILCSIFLFFVSYFHLFKKDYNFKDFRNKLLLITSIVFGLVLWWFIRNAILYNGDIIGIETSDHYAEMYARADLKPSARITLAKQGIPFYSFIIHSCWAPMVYFSFIGLFGYMKIKITPYWIYIVYFIFFLLFVVGLIWNVISKRKLFKNKKHIVSKYFNITMFIAFLIPIILSLHYSYYSDFQPQGRYLAPLIIPLMYFLVIGLKQLMNKIVKTTRLKKIILTLIGTFYALSPIYCLIFILIPQYNK